VDRLRPRSALPPTPATRPGHDLTQPDASLAPAPPRRSSAARPAQTQRTLRPRTEKQERRAALNPFVRAVDALYPPSLLSAISARARVDGPIRRAERRGDHADVPGHGVTPHPRRRSYARSRLELSTPVESRPRARLSAQSWGLEVVAEGWAGHGQLRDDVRDRRGQREPTRSPRPSRTPVSAESGRVADAPSVVPRGGRGGVQGEAAVTEERRGQPTRS
jgi:hypothetical protein